MIMALIRWRVIFMGHSLQGRAGLGEEEGPGTLGTHGPAQCGNGVARVGA